jgi:phenylacetate-CoA ligase
MVETNEYWNPVLETLPREKLQKLQLAKFKEIVRWAYDRSKFYHKLYSDAGMEPGDIKKFEDIRKVPRMEKSMLRGIQGKEPFPYGDILCVPLKDVTEYRQTSGTTGQPVYQADTWQDWELSTETFCYALYAQGYRDTDRFFLPFGYNIFIAFWAAHYAAEKIGCEVIPGGVLNTEARILKMQELKATAMGATPSYVLGMAETARKSPSPANPGAASRLPGKEWRRRGALKFMTRSAAPKSATGAGNADIKPVYTSMKASSWWKSKILIPANPSPSRARGARWW